MEKRIKDNLDYYNQYLDFPFKNNNDPNYFVDNHNYYEEFWDEDENEDASDRFEQGLLYEDEDEKKKSLWDDLLLIEALKEDGSL